MFDPKIALNRHIALLVARDNAAEYVDSTRGLNQAIGKVVGQVITHKLAESKRSMRDNKMWVDEVPIRGMRYQYSFQGRRHEYEASQADIDLHIKMVLNNFEQVFKQV
ncbi:hypothetical protein GXP70_18040 [Paenibacillus lycopersici]|uniref:Uncharacterized protein n=1 Tax=Paenibacillus lycopersici TaxID=2704462 RepID=A0A6C0G6S8_9BACL|nr:hypothetical protein [Paenibacillus lycopersici]QHT61685.1 hypothetical protein GXP70_18040 [Paenibacillus lycopersici]